MSMYDTGALCARSIYINRYKLDECLSLIQKLKNPDHICIITDRTVASLYEHRLKCALNTANCNVVSYVVDDGEDSKSLASYMDIIAFLHEHRFTRSSMIITLGGGKVCDFGAFVASTYMRGCHLLAIPTSLLACVDAAVGGKTALNFDMTKNLIGTFYEPEAVLIDTSVFATLSRELITQGTAEIIKCALLADKEMFYSLSEPLLWDDSRMVEAVSFALSVKLKFCDQDIYDHGSRHMLNLGHTFAHALETCSDYQISHGSAVGAGLILCAHMSMHAQLLSQKTCNALTRVLYQAGFYVPHALELHKLIDAIKSDKKNSGTMIREVLLRECAQPVIEEMSCDYFLNLLSAALASEREVSQCGV